MFFRNYWLKPAKSWRRICSRPSWWSPVTSSTPTRSIRSQTTTTFPSLQTSRCPKRHSSSRRARCRARPWRSWSWRGKVWMRRWPPRHSAPCASSTRFATSSSCGARWSRPSTSPTLSLCPSCPPSRTTAPCTWLTSWLLSASSTRQGYARYSWFSCSTRRVVFYIIIRALEKNWK